MMLGTSRMMRLGHVESGLWLRVCSKKKYFSLFFNPNICCRYSNKPSRRPSRRDGYMLNLMGKKNNYKFVYLSLCRAQHWLGRRDPTGKEDKFGDDKRR